MSIASAGRALLSELAIAEDKIRAARNGLEDALVQDGHDLDAMKAPAKVNRALDRIDAADRVLTAIQKAKEDLTRWTGTHA